MSDEVHAAAEPLSALAGLWLGICTHTLFTYHQTQSAWGSAPLCVTQSLQRSLRTNHKVHPQGSQ